MADHYYTRDGQPCYTIIGKNGKERATNVRDAREKGLVPSVTTILNLAAKPALLNWMLDQAIMAALTLPREADETEAEYIKRVKQDSKQQGKDAADEGSRIHDAVEIHMTGGSVIERFIPYCEGVETMLFDTFGQHRWTHEKPFACDMGYGGKVDLFTDGIVLDIKTKEFDEDDKVVGYEEHCIQLAAYRYGLGMPEAQCANVFVSRNNPGLVKVFEWPESELKKGWQLFCHYLSIWQIKNLEDV